MMEFVTGNMFDAEVEALVNTVNTVGVMGKGIALQFKQTFPENYRLYRAACQRGEVTTGKMFVVYESNVLGGRIIVNFPTKEHWRSPSRYEYIETGLVDLRRVIEERDIRSIAIPPLGCGNGGLDWSRVKTIIEQALGDLDARIVVFTPNQRIKKTLQEKENSKPVQLTPARAMLLHLLFAYERSGELSSLFVANKLAWFLQRRGEPLRLNFKPHHYGPYSVQLNHVLLALNGTYLRGMEQNQIKAFEPLLLNYDQEAAVNAYLAKHLNDEQHRRLQDVQSLLRGYESTFSVELLASVDYLMQSGKKTLEEIELALRGWNQRKQNMFRPQHLEIAFEHLNRYAGNIFGAS